MHDNLWFKLIHLGLRGNILNIIKSKYESIKSRVKFCDKLGTEFFCSLGVRQGECLSPVLFSLYVNDIEDHFSYSGFEGLDFHIFKIFLLLYADSADELQTGLDSLSVYCNGWKMKVNVSKTKILIFRKLRWYNT